MHELAFRQGLVAEVYYNTGPFHEMAGSRLIAILLVNAWASGGSREAFSSLVWISYYHLCYNREIATKLVATNQRPNGSLTSAHYYA